MFNRRQFIAGSVMGAGALGLNTLLPAWARPASAGNMGLAHAHGSTFNLKVGKFPVEIGGRKGEAVGVNDTLPAPLIRFREGEHVTKT